MSWKLLTIEEISRFKFYAILPQILHLYFGNSWNERQLHIHPVLDVFFSWFCRLAQGQGTFVKYVSRRRWWHYMLSPALWTFRHHKSIYSNILTRCMSEWCFSLLSWNLKVVSLHYCVTSQLRLCAPILTTKNIYLCYCVLCICDIYVFCICEYFNKHSFVTSDLLLMLLSVQQFQAEKWWFDEKPQGHAPDSLC